GLAFAPGERLLASSSTDRTVRLWDVESGVELATLRGHEHEVLRVRFSADGKLLASTGRDGTIKLWRITLSDDDPPFVLAHVGQPERKFPSLATAVRNATSGDVIEVRGNGPFVTDPILIQGKALTIRAGVGYWPLLVSAVGRTNNPGQLLVSNA